MNYHQERSLKNLHVLLLVLLDLRANLEFLVKKVLQVQLVKGDLLVELEDLENLVNKVSLEFQEKLVGLEYKERLVFEDPQDLKVSKEIGDLLVRLDHLGHLVDKVYLENQGQLEKEGSLVYQVLRESLENEVHLETSALSLDPWDHLVKKE